MTASRSPRPTSPSRRSTSGSRCRTSAGWSSPISKRSTRRTSTRRSSNSPSRRRSSSSATRCRPSLRSSPKHVYEGSADIAADPANAKLIGTGPFKFAEHKPGEYYRLEKNDAYWGEGQPQARRDRLPRAARPRGGGRRARGRRDPARRLQPGAARRPRPHLQGRGHQGLFDRL